MEEGRPQDDASRVEQNNPTPVERGSFLRYLDRLFRDQEKDDDTEEETEEETAERPTRKTWRGFLHRVLGGRVETVDQQSQANEDTDQPRRGSLIDTLLGEPDLATVPLVYEGLAGEPAEVEDAIEPVVDELPEIDALHTTDTTTPELSEDTPLEMVSEDEVPPETEPAPEVPPPIELLPTTEEPAAEIAEDGTLTVIHSPYEAGPAPIIAAERTPRATERIIERDRRANMAGVLVGLEYFGRKRADRKLARNFDKKIEAASKEIKYLKKTQEQQERMIKKNQSEALAEKASRQAEARKAEEVLTVPKPPEKTFAEALTPRTEGEAATTAIERSPVTKPEKILLHREKEVAPERVLEQVASAAEKDIAVEKIYEKRHEIKDDPAVASGPVSVGSILSGSTSPIAATAFAGADDSSTSQQTSPFGAAGGLGNAPTEPELYKDAMKNGFLVAVGIIIFVVVAAILT